MALKTLVKVGEVNNLSDARFCAGMGVELLGFSLKHPERKIISKEEYVAITGWLSGPLMVGEFIDASDQEILDLDVDLTFDYIQTNDPNQANRLKEQGKKVIFLLQDSFVPQVNVDYVLVESGIDIDALSDQHEVLLGTEIEVSKLDALLSSEKVSGINLKGGDEIRPGYKDFDELADILEALEID